MSALKNELLELDKALTNVNRDEVFTDCINTRLNNLLVIQSSSFDRCLNSIEEAVTMDMRDIDCAKRLNNLFKELYHLISVNRYEMVSIMMRLCGDEVM